MNHYHDNGYVETTVEPGSTAHSNAGVNEQAEAHQPELALDDQVALVMAVVFSFLASEEASYIAGTGKTIYACGGFTLFDEFRENWAS